MNTKQFTILTMLLILIVTIGGSACSMTKINAQNPNNRETAHREISESKTPAYNPPKRISKDIIKTEETSEKPLKIKQKKK